MKLSHNLPLLSAIILVFSINGVLSITPDSCFWCTAVGLTWDLSTK